VDWTYETSRILGMRWNGEVQHCNIGVGENVETALSVNIEVALF
jgi:hypothetical protein